MSVANVGPQAVAAYVGSAVVGISHSESNESSVTRHSLVRLGVI
jgi:hypothetical protein